MSDERRIRKEERESGGKSSNFRTYAGIAILLAGAYYGGWYYKNHKYDSFAKCLTANQTKMYGLYWCPHCIEQKEMFGAAFHNVAYVECATKGSSEEVTQCTAAGVKLFPSWQFGAEPPKEGVLSLEALSDKTGCRLP